MDNVKHFYDLSAPQYAEEWYSNDLLLPSIREFCSLFHKKPLILDLGCGPGQESMRIAQQNADVIGIDFSSESINIAKQKNPNIQFYC
jgi:2-polyprenyl-3-methyl-5-hydroxy-6-metoxy-1,4-benzoquinol methylase